MFNDSDFDVLDDALENVKGGSIAEQITTVGDTLNTASINVRVAVPSLVSTARPLNVNVVGPSTSTARDIFKDKMTTIADTLVAIRRARPRTTSVMILREKEQRIAREKAAEQEAKDAALIEQMEDVQARMDADELLAERLQQEEREQFIVDEQARMLVDLIAERKKFFAAQRAEQIRNRPPTKAQLRNKMVTYLKHMGNYTHTQLKSKIFEEIQKLYEKEQKWINDFVPLDSEMVKDSGKEDGDSQKQAESSKKRSRAEHDEESVKKQKLEDEAEREELRACLDIVLGDDIAMDFESLATKYPIIDWKTHILTENMMYYQIIRADGSSKNYKIFSGMLDDFDKQDVIDLYRLVKERLFDSCGVHVLLMDTGIAIHMMSVVKPGTIRTVLSLAASRHWPVHQLDVKNAFLHGDLSKTVYMHQPLGFRDSSHPNYVCLLQRSLYGLKQAPHLLHRIISSLHLEFAMTDLGSLNYFLGISVARDSSGCFYLRRSDAVVSLNGLGDVVSDPTMYQSLAGSLQYLTFTRPDNCHIMDSGSSGQRNYQAESDQKDKMRHAMDDNGIPSKEIHERHRERAITAEEALDDTKPLQYVPKSQTDQ
ncbi:retrovirus-related pol polyprotein from transposon TNT 1-94 [Tanacetum coccineum]